MINNFNYIQKNNVEIFKVFCSDLNKGIDNILTKLNEIRDALYKCTDQQVRPLNDSSHDADCLLINNNIKQSCSLEKKEVFQSTMNVLYFYREQFILIDRNIKNKLKNICDLHQRNSLNRKMYEILMIKRQVINNYFFTQQDDDSPTKIKSDVFKF